MAGIGAETVLAFLILAVAWAARGVLFRALARATETGGSRGGTRTLAADDPAAVEQLVVRPIAPPPDDSSLLPAHAARSNDEML